MDWIHDKMGIVDDKESLVRGGLTVSGFDVYIQLKFLKVD